jgi:hypothetical protein
MNHQPGFSPYFGVNSLAIISEGNTNCKILVLYQWLLLPSKTALH